MVLSVLANSYLFVISLRKKSILWIVLLNDFNDLVERYLFLILFYDQCGRKHKDSILWLFLLN